MLSLVDSINHSIALKPCCQHFEETEVAIDIEGVELSRAGEVCLIQICGPSSDKVFLFDIHTLKDRRS